MAVPRERLMEAGKTFAEFWDDYDITPIGPLYREDAVFLSPNPPFISSEFGTILRGREEILSYFKACMAKFPAGAQETRAIITGIDMAVWVYETAMGDMMADVMVFDDDGLIESHRVTASPLVS